MRTSKFKGKKVGVYHRQRVNPLGGEKCPVFQENREERYGKKVPKKEAGKGEDPTFSQKKESTPEKTLAVNHLLLGCRTLEKRIISPKGNPVKGKRRRGVFLNGTISQIQSPRRRSAVEGKKKTGKERIALKLTEFFVPGCHRLGPRGSRPSSEKGGGGRGKKKIFRKKVTNCNLGPPGFTSLEKKKNRFVEGIKRSSKRPFVGTTLFIQKREAESGADHSGKKKPGLVRGVYREKKPGEDLHGEREGPTHLPGKKKMNVERGGGGKAG